MLLENNLQGFQHLGLPVTNLENSKTFYMNFGFKEVMRTDLHPKEQPIRVAMLEKSGFTIELYQLHGSERDEIASRTDGHIDHIALNVRDIDAAFAEIKSAELIILEENAPVYLPFWKHGVKFFTVRGPDGEKVEFNQILPG
jgi:catechol 2,3-dioxygenase-like lactoylglutathione lyase family enzyme